MGSNPGYLLKCFLLYQVLIFWFLPKEAVKLGALPCHMYVEMITTREQAKWEIRLFPTTSNSLNLCINTEYNKYTEEPPLCLTDWRINWLNSTVSFINLMLIISYNLCLLTYIVYVQFMLLSWLIMRMRTVLPFQKRQRKFW